MEIAFIGGLISLVGVLYENPVYIMLSRFKEIKEWKEMLSQDQLKALILFTESLGDAMMQQANKHLQFMEKSSNPERELTIVIKALEDAIIFYTNAVQQNRSIFPRVLGISIWERMHYYEKITTCNIMLSRLYLAAGDPLIAQCYVTDALRAFDSYALLQKRYLAAKIKDTFRYVDIYNSGTRLVLISGYYKGKDEELFKLRILYQTRKNKIVFEKLAEERLRQEKSKIFNPLESLIRLAV
jgi:hypothetical protein